MIAQSTTYLQRLSTTLLIVAAMVVCGVMFNASTLQSQSRPGGDKRYDVDSAAVLDSLYALQVEEWRAGVYLGVNVNLYSVDNLQGMPGVPSCCPGFDEGMGLGIAVGGLVETPLNDWFSVGARLYLSTYNGHLIDEETEVVDDEGFAANAIFEHRIDADIQAVAIEPVGLIEVVEDLKFFAGVRGDVVLRKLFAQQEQIITPDNIVYENGRRIRFEFDGAVPNGTSFQGAVLAGLRYDFYLGEDNEFVIAPEISAWYSPTPVISNESWKIHGIRLAISGQYLHYEFDQEDYLIEPIKAPLDPEAEEASLRIESMYGPSGADARAVPAGDEFGTESESRP